MANKIVKDSLLAIFVKEIQVANTVQPNDLVAVGAVVGLAGDTPRKGEDGNYYTTVDTAALVRIDNVAIAFTDKAPVYITPGGAISGTATSNTLIGYADRPKSSASGPLQLQLIPKAA